MVRERTLEITFLEAGAEAYAFTFELRDSGAMPDQSSPRLRRGPAGRSLSELTAEPSGVRHGRST
jgi:hypothetical protein